MFVRWETYRSGMASRTKGNRGEGAVLAQEQVEHTPDVNDLATLLAHAMRRPLTGSGNRPLHVRVRKNRRWEELFPHLQEVGVEVVVASESQSAVSARFAAAPSGIASIRGTSTPRDSAGSNEAVFAPVSA